MLRDKDLVGRRPKENKLAHPEVTPTTSCGRGAPFMRAINTAWDLGGIVTVLCDTTERLGSMEMDTPPSPNCICTL